jgi:hypothetical protein
MQRKSLAGFESKGIYANDGIPLEARNPKRAIGIKDAMYSTAVRYRENPNRATSIGINLYDAAVLRLVRPRQTADWAAICAHP